MAVTFITDADKKELKELIETKAPKATTLEGYGIKDAYTKAQANEQFQTKLTEEQLQNLEKVEELEKNKAEFANALKGNAIGNSVTLDDVSPIEHALDVKVQTKNIYPFPLTKCRIPENGSIVSAADNECIAKGASGSSGSAYSSGWCYLYNKSYTGLIDFAKDIVTVSAEITLVEEGIHGATFTFCPKTLTGGVVYTATTTPTRFSFTAKTSDIKEIYVALNANTLKIANVQFEYGTEATEYTPYLEELADVRVEVSDDNGRVEGYQPSEDGSIEGGILSSQSMEIVAVNPNMSAVVDVTYNRDINKAFAELQTLMTSAIVSLGGDG